MGSAIKQKKKDEFTGIVEAIADERVRYFYLMLGEALGEAMAQNQVPGETVQANTSPAHIAGIAERLNRN